MISITKKSFIEKVFLKVMCLFIVITIMISLSIEKYADNIMRKELISFSQDILKEISEDISTVVMDGVYLAQRVAYNSDLIEQLQQSTDEYVKTERLKGITEVIMNDYTWLYSQQHKRLYDVYILDEAGRICYRSDNTKREIELQVDGVIQDVPTLTATIKDSGAQGIYQHVFQVHQPIKDHLSNELVGKVVVNITEKVLYDCYANRKHSQRFYSIVDQEGRIVSHKDKRKIGEDYFGEGMRLKESHAALNGWMTYKKDKQTYNVFYTKIPATDWYIVETLHLEQLMQPIKNIKIYIYLCLLLVITISIFVLKGASRAVREPVDHIRNQMQKVTEGNLEAYIEEIREDELGQISESFNEMLAQITDLMEEIKDTEKQKRLAELDFLKAQMNPHFVYNTLSSIRFFVEMGKNKEAEDMLFYFSKILRATLSAQNQFIKIQEELTLIHHYVALQKLRYGDSFEVKDSVPEVMLEQTVPHFILQPIIENAIFYGINKRDGRCKIEIGGRIQEEEMVLWVKDDGIGMSEAKIKAIFEKENKMNSIGIRNVHERIQLNYGKQYGLEIESEEGKGVQVVFKFPNEKGVLRC